MDDDSLQKLQDDLETAAFQIRRSNEGAISDDWVGADDEEIESYAARLSALRERLLNQMHGLSGCSKIEGRHGDTPSSIAMRDFSEELRAIAGGQPE